MVVYARICDSTLVAYAGVLVLAEYPTEQDFQNTEIYLPSKPIIRPTDISQVVPIQLQQQVARSIRSNCSEMMSDCLSVLRDAYGFVNHENGAHTAMGWQFANERARSHIFSAPTFSQGIVQCKPLQKHIIYAASKSHTTTQQHKQSIENLCPT